ncbi:MAG: hypothetical protein CMC33_02445 [Flavobacteriaceae bacterium]|nr:hypothetical protein [Flavobacteriaceae bacterium]
MGKAILSIGIFISILGLILMLADKYPNLYNNPLDFTYKKENFSFYFPIGTSIILSIVFSLLFYLFKK